MNLSPLVVESGLAIARHITQLRSETTRMENRELDEALDRLCDAYLEVWGVIGQIEANGVVEP